jgi:hypothetical protein
LFDRTVSLHDYIHATIDHLAELGFTPDNTLAIVSTCRDEICQPLVSEVQTVWGEAFDLNALGGLTFAGTTGIRAALAHAPVQNGKKKVLLIGAPHIAVDANGTLGVVERTGLNVPSSACGALLQLVNEYKAHDTCPAIDNDDMEYGHLRAHLWDQTSKDLGQTTHQAALAVHARLHSLCEKTMDAQQVDYAILTLILVHKPHGKDAVVPVTSLLRLGGISNEMPALSTALLK